MMGSTFCSGLFGSGMGFMGGGMFITGLAVLMLIFAFVYFFSGDHTKLAKQKNALEILKEEYAKGNMTDDEYQRRKHNLEG
ncbi:hypothetical protein [Companilactobacillus sp.]|uniref:SHOCT domain-containing protein n=1 Tax=Companilactobacillus sp. TaxID=2767905 RepID=UPI00260A5E56|nr:hypothetical protein [Companilactobacillus sp.]